MSEEGKEITAGNLNTVIETEAQIVIQPPDNPKEQFAKLQELAICWKPFIELNSTRIGNSKYPHVETYQAMAGTHGCSLSIPPESVIYDSSLKGWKATGQVVRMSDGKVIATAIAFLGDDEPLWKNRPVHAKRAMVQTRAMSRVGRSVFAYIIVLSGAKVKTTPAEEMPEKSNGNPDPNLNPQREKAHTLLTQCIKANTIKEEARKNWEGRIADAKNAKAIEAVISSLQTFADQKQE